MLLSKNPIELFVRTESGFTLVAVHAHMLPLEVHHLWLVLIKLIVRAYLLLLHLLWDIIIGNNTMVQA
jgi:hypothetical protein